MRRLDEQAERVLSVQPDLVCLQEMRATTVSRWREHLDSAGLDHALSGDPAPARAQGRSRALMVLTAACVPLSGVGVPGLPWPERVVAARLADGLLAVNVHSPISPSPALAKVLTHEAVSGFLSADGGARGPVLLCGDLNTPRREHADGRVWTFARDRYGRLRPDRGERWDAAELALIKGLEPIGLRDAFRALYGYERRELSWEWPRWGGGYRLDHLILSPSVTPRHVEYLHDWRREGLSDHSPLLAEVSVEV